AGTASAASADEYVTAGGNAGELSRVDPGNAGELSSLGGNAGELSRVITVSNAGELSSRRLGGRHRESNVSVIRRQHRRLFRVLPWAFTGLMFGMVVAGLLYFGQPANVPVLQLAGF